MSVAIAASPHAPQHKETMSAVEFRADIEGLRAVAALLVASYHVWSGRVSGGVDVFFVISGYLVTLSLLREMDRKFSIDLPSFWMRLIRRLGPAAYLVLSVAVVGSLLFVPASRWLETQQQILASALYVENWLLALNSVDYLAREDAPSPVQHFWALSIQGQFYLLWPLSIAVVFAASRWMRWNGKAVLFVVASTACLISFFYSILVTAENQPWAYFDTGARFWEFGIGALLAISGKRLLISKFWAMLAGWAALSAIMLCGIIFSAADSFPGLGALWPTSAALVILLVGQNGGRYGVGALLGSKPMVGIGSVAYHIYLWHWPLLVFLIAARGGKNITDLQGFAIIAIAISLSLASSRWVEAPVRSGKVLSNRAFIVALIAPVVVLVGVGSYTRQLDLDRLELARREAIKHPGAKSRMPGFQPPQGYDPSLIAPAPSLAKLDQPKIFFDGCTLRSDEFYRSPCRYGNVRNPPIRIALVGGSHAAHLFPGLEAVALKNNWEILVFAKNACRWTTESENEWHASCYDWNQHVTPELVEMHPDLVVTTANIRNNPKIPEGYIDQWKEVTAAGIRILAIRDNPSFPFKVPECVERNGLLGVECALPRRALGIFSAPYLDRVTFVDISDFLCDDAWCGASVGGVLIYRDDDHFTATYSNTLAPIFEQHIKAALRAR